MGVAEVSAEVRKGRTLAHLRDAAVLLAVIVVGSSFYVTGLGRYVLHSAGEIPAAIDAAMASDAVDPALLAMLQGRIDAHFDRLARMARRQAAARWSRRIYRGLRRRLVRSG